MSEKRTEPLKFSRGDLIKIESYVDQLHGERTAPITPAHGGIFLVLSYHGAAWNNNGGPLIDTEILGELGTLEWWHRIRTGEWLHMINLLLENGPKHCSVDQSRITIIQKGKSIE